MSDWKCPFCGSDKLKFPSPYVELNSQGEYVPKMEFCCKSQKQNQNFINKRFKEGDKPDLEKVGEWD